MVKRYRNGWWLEHKYHGEGWTQREIGEECGVSPRTIRKWMARRGVDTREVKGENHGLYGRERSDEVKERIADALRGREFSEEARRRMADAKQGKEIPDEIRERIAESLSGMTRPESTRRKMSEARAGEGNPQWKGGGSVRYGPGWSAAREWVRERDEVCQHCGHDGSEDRLEVHHIVPMRAFHDVEEASLRTAHDESNLVLLCRPCHVRAEWGDIEFESGIDPPTERE